MSITSIIQLLDNLASHRAVGSLRRAIDENLAFGIKTVYQSRLKRDLIRVSFLQAHLIAPVVTAWNTIRLY
ncbi:unnamed protein product [Fusarium graminearum]|nr:unnamed protein product [Fusarium graminearum]